VKPTAARDHEHDYERGSHIREAFGVDGRTYACAICGETKTGGPVATYDAIQGELRAKARNAAARNKPTMWGYLCDVSDALREYFADVERTDGSYAGAAQALVEQAQERCPVLDPLPAARLWARSVYARRILRAWTKTAAPRASLAWLRDRENVTRPVSA
jgi:hypothetical protein